MKKILTATLICGLITAAPAAAQTTDRTRWRYSTSTDAMTDIVYHHAAVYRSNRISDKSSINLACTRNQQSFNAFIFSNLTAAKAFRVEGMARIDRNPPFHFQGKTRGESTNPYTRHATEITSNMWEWIPQMKAGRWIVVRLYEEGGHRHDMTFSLSGFTRAFDRMAALCAPPPRPRFQQSRKEREESPSWSFAEYQDPMTDEKTKVAVALVKESYIGFVCREDKYITLIASSERPIGKITEEGNTEWLVRVDKEAPFTIQGIVRKGNNGKPYAETPLIPQKLIEQMKAGGEVRIRTYGPGGRSQDATFTLRKFKQSYSQLGNSCGE